MVATVFVCVATVFVSVCKGLAATATTFRRSGFIAGMEWRKQVFCAIAGIQAPRQLTDGDKLQASIDAAPLVSQITLRPSSFQRSRIASCNAAISSGAA